MSPKCNFMIRPFKPKLIEKEKYETLSSSSKNFGSEQTYKGGPLSLVSIHFGLQGLSKIAFLGPWTYSQIKCN